MVAQGYIGRNPADSSVVISRQSFTASGITTDFTFASGYTVGYFDLYINGVKLVEGSDYTASDSATFAVLNGGAQDGDVLEGVAYKAFNLGDASRIGIQSAGIQIGNAETLNFVGTGNTFSVNGTTIDVSISGSAGAGGTWATYDSNTGITTNKKVKIDNKLEVTGFTTLTGGARWNSTFHGMDDGQMYFGDGYDLRIVHDGNTQNSKIWQWGPGELQIHTNTNIAFNHQDSVNSGNIGSMAQFIREGACELYHNDSKKFETTGTGATVYGTTQSQQLNVSGVSTFSNNVTVDGGDITLTSQGDKLIFTADASNPASGGAIEISTSGSGTAEISGNSNQLRIYNQQDANHSIAMRAGEYYFQDESANYYALFSSGAVKLYHPNTAGGITDQKLETTADGIAVAGIVTASSGIVTYYGDGSNLTGIEAGISTAAHVANNSVVTLNLTAAQDHKITATGICTITVTGGTEADSHTVRLINSGIATVGFSTYFLFPSGSTPSLPEADGSISLLSFTVNRVGAGGTQLLTGASLNYS